MSFLICSVIHATFAALLFFFFFFFWVCAVSLCTGVLYFFLSVIIYRWVPTTMPVMPATLGTRGGGEQTAKPSSFERMAAIQEEIAKIETRLRSLQSTEDADDTPWTSAPQEDMDPAVAKMLSVELCHLAASGDSVGVRLLLESGADTDCRDYDEQTPLHIASALGHVQVVRLLLEFGADPTLLDKDDKTPFRLAGENNRREVVQLLLRHSQEHGHELDACGKPDSFLLDSPIMSAHPDFSQIPQPMMGSLIVIMVGLPGRGKTYIARQIQRYFKWNGLQSRIFIRSTYKEKLEEGGVVSTALSAAEVERRIAAAIAKDMTQFIDETDGVAVLNGTNCSPLRRMALMSAIRETGLIRPNRVIFVEVVNNNSEIVRLNVNRKKEINPGATQSFVDQYYARIERLNALYKSLSPTTDRDLTYILIEDQTTFALNNISGWMPSRLSYMLHNLNHAPSNLYLTRAGEYVDLIAGRIGGNSRLTERGQAYSEALFEYFQGELQMKSFTVMSSCALRCIETVQYFEEQSVLQRSSASAAQIKEPKLNCRVAYFPTLDSLNHGDCDGQLLSDVRRAMPSTLLHMQADPYHTAWPNGECVHQLYNARLEPHIHDIQASTEPVLVVSHLQLLQGLYSYFVSENDDFVAPQDAYKIDIPFESVIKIRLVGFNRVAETIDLSKEVDRIQHRRTGKVTKATQQSSLNIFCRSGKK
ncbi:6-phosphofructo-2-kinase/fructose-2,6-biphosphatase, putative [Trypanosoma cruzi]|uniref:6-phosphofructo-2-kinase/fructose-2, 6-biphosphatase, putative n=2 Tax=Trypanosoma cruzi TaxID=5693 RepID=Q4CWE5_TRYCC|nr:6-phosphofructo-2-kinase/fructose-2,6-biphosphatase, putative [Trypanosoma cruzi]EAN84594.1 6-phosphofructo-2-kinase/fructose-2,6-biphosphatase, putative [Trypanosoma cruzi]|eukprot:XP_806445.1 6-phosphofructo-2-kinase/fructose-2,6-biphosphatase [Trypanosoma cruzi strain CL Brener]